MTSMNYIKTMLVGLAYRVMDLLLFLSLHVLILRFIVRLRNDLLCVEWDVKLY